MDAMSEEHNVRYCLYYLPDAPSQLEPRTWIPPPTMEVEGGKVGSNTIIFASVCFDSDLAQDNPVIPPKKVLKSEK